MILKVIALTFCVIAFIYPLYVAPKYKGTNELGQAQMVLLIGKSLIVLITMAFAMLSTFHLYLDTPDWIKDFMRIGISTITIYTVHRLDSVLIKALSNHND
jgi:LPS O-antigen subunit length determinant protein (WzzB/FepE family)